MNTMPSIENWALDWNFLPMRGEISPCISTTHRAKIPNQQSKMQRIDPLYHLLNTRYHNPHSLPSFPLHFSKNAPDSMSPWISTTHRARTPKLAIEYATHISPLASTKATLPYLHSLPSFPLHFSQKITHFAGGKQFHPASQPPPAHPAPK